MMHSAARCKRSYADDPTLSDRVFDLLETWFVGIGARRSEAATLGSTWDACSTPFVCEENGQIVSHVGLLETTIVVLGQETRLGGVHGVCTLESERRKGHFRRCMESLLEDCEGRLETLVLTTENPEYYEPFGFRTVAEHKFVAPVAPRAKASAFRPFDLARAGELDRLDRLLEERTPVSNVYGVVRELDIFKFSQGSQGLYYSDDLDCFAVFELSGSRTTIIDVVARELPPIDELLARIPSHTETVEFYFSPDRFDVAARPEIFRYDQDQFLVRGPFAAEHEHFMVPPPARH